MAIAGNFFGGLSTDRVGAKRTVIILLWYGYCDGMAD